MAVSNRCRTRPPRGTPGRCTILTDRDVLTGLLEDAAHSSGGHAAGVAYPRTEADVVEVLRGSARVLPLGAQSSLTGGATPRGDVLLSTARLDGTRAAAPTRITVEAGVTLETVQAALRSHDAVYPPVPTYLGATVGGCVANNAAGAATFKYGSTRQWVEALTVVLASGEVLDLTRGECIANGRGFFIETAGGPLQVPVASYRMPDVPKRSAGYFAEPGMDLVDLFIGSEGTLGVITEVTLRAVAPAPAIALALIFCRSGQQGLDLATQLRRASIETWRTGNPSGLDVSGIEHMDERSLAIVRAHGDAAHLHVAEPEGAALALLVQLELPAGTTAAAAYEQIGAALQPDAPATGLVELCRMLDRFDVLDRTELAAPGDTARQQQLIRFREAVPTRVNQLVGAARRDVDPRIEKTAADMIVPFERLAEMMERYARAFGERGLAYAVWGHVSDGNVHPNVIPRSYEDVLRGREAILELGREAARLGGCPLAEHGVGRSPVKQALLRQLYGEEGIREMRGIKRALDPGGILAAGVVFPEETGV
jgi:D-lactate dehydrogenase (cytochrome)